MADRCTGEETPFVRHFILKPIILQRQARDKHRESTQKRAFSYSNNAANNYPLMGYEFT